MTLEGARKHFDETRQNTTRVTIQAKRSKPVLAEHKTNPSSPTFSIITPESLNISFEIISEAKFKELRMNALLNTDTSDETKPPF